MSMNQCKIMSIDKDIVQINTSYNIVLSQLLNIEIDITVYNNYNVFMDLTIIVKH